MIFDGVKDRVSHLFDFSDKNAKAAIVSDLETYGTGIEPEITMDKLVQYRNTDAKFRLAVMFGTAFSVGIGFHNTADTTTPSGRRVLEIVDDFCEEWDLDSLNQSIAQDVWATGNAFLRPMGTPRKMQGVQMVPVSSIIRIRRDIDGSVVHYEQTWGSQYRHIEADKIMHFKWMAENSSAWGTGLGQPLARRGVGYKTASGKVIHRPSLFQISEMLTDIEAKMVYAGLPRYDVEAEVKDAALQDVQNAFNALDPLQHTVHNFKTDISTVALDTQSRFDSFIRYLDDNFLNGIMTPIPRMFSSLNFTYASADASIESYLPLVRMYQRAHKRFVENHIYKPLIVQERGDISAVKKSQIALQWGQQGETEFEEIRQVYDILKDPMFNGRYDPEDLLDMIREKVPQLSKVEEPMEELDERVKELGEITDRAEKKVDIRELPAEDQYKILRNQVLEKIAHGR